jgi:hypothetical protein
LQQFDLETIVIKITKEREKNGQHATTNTKRRFDQAQIVGLNATNEQKQCKQLEHVACVDHIRLLKKTSSEKRQTRRHK